MEIRYNQHGRCVHLSDEDVERLGQEYLYQGGETCTGVPFYVFVAVKVHEFLGAMRATFPRAPMDRVN